MKDEKDWTDAVYKELISEAQTRYPKGTIFNCLAYGHISHPVFSTGVFSKSHLGGRGIFNRVETGTTYDGLVFENGKWAEIISQPKAKKESSPGKNLNEYRKDVLGLGPIEDQAIEPKAGDMVEAWEDFDEWTTGWKYLGVKNSFDRYICEWPDTGTTYEFDKIRLPQKSEAESKAKQIMQKIHFSLYPMVVNQTEKALVEAIKWGQQNPDKK